MTKGAQYEVTNPNNALAQGLFRVTRTEDSNTKPTTLDIQSSTSPATCLAINEILKLLKNSKLKTFIETDFEERDGTLYVHRLVPDTPINDSKRNERERAPSLILSLCIVYPMAQYVNAEVIGILQERIEMPLRIDRYISLMARKRSVNSLPIATASSRLVLVVAST